MMLRLPGVLDADQLATVRRALEGAPFVDGRLSAGEMAESVKNNLELDRNAPQRDLLNRAVMGAVYADPRYQAAVLPLRAGTPIFARYTPGMAYGEHTDDPIMGAGAPQYRCDVTLTVFLNGPDEYDGGELVIRTAFGESRDRFEAGDAIVYPSSSLHRVAEVTRGERLVMVTWIQSLVRDPARRELLYQLWQARETVRGRAPQSEEAAQIDFAYVNLVRMWSEL